MTTVRTLLPLAVALSAMALPATAQTVSTSVSHVGLDLTDADGRDAFERRIAIAARSVCRIGDGRMLSVNQAERRCVRDAVDGVAPQVAGIENTRIVQIALASPAPVAPR